MQTVKMSSLMKTLIVVIAFFTYNFVITAILNVFGITNEVITMFVPDIIFLIGILIVYGKPLLADVKSFHKDHKFSKRLLIVLLGFIILVGVNMGASVISSIISPEEIVDDNTNALYSLNTLYTIFKVLVFSVIAEELVFRKAIGDVIENKIAFVIISSLVYSLTNILYSDLTSIVVWAGVVSYFAIYLTLSIIYVRNNDNIYPVMIMKFLFNLIPVAILLSGV